MNKKTLFFSIFVIFVLIATWLLSQNNVNSDTIDEQISINEIQSEPKAKASQSSPQSISVNRDPTTPKDLSSHQKYSSKNQRKINRLKSDFSKYAYGNGLALNGQEFYMTDLVAIKKSAAPDSAEIIEDKGGYLIIKKTDEDLDLSHVMYNQKRSSLVIITGELKIKMSDLSYLNFILNKYSLETIQVFDHLKLAHVIGAATSLEKLLFIKSQVAFETGVIRVDLEIIDTIAETN